MGVGDAVRRQRKLFLKSVPALLWRTAVRNAVACAELRVKSTLTAQVALKDRKWPP